MIIFEPLEITNYGKPTGKYRLVRYSDEDSRVPKTGNPACFHDSKNEASDCEECKEYLNYSSHFPDDAEDPRDVLLDDMAGSIEGMADLMDYVGCKEHKKLLKRYNELRGK